jgi:hypothetical protein
MPLKLSEVLAKAGKEDMVYVHDAPIHYVVLNRKENTWNMERIEKYMALLD